MPDQNGAADDEENTRLLINEAVKDDGEDGTTGTVRTNVPQKSSNARE